MSHLPPFPSHLSEIPSFLFPNSDSLKGSNGLLKRVSQCHGRGVRRMAGVVPGSAGHAAGQVRARCAHFTFHCACGAILIVQH